MNINSAPWSGMGHFEKLGSAYSQERLASSWTIEQQVHADFSKLTIFSDEAHIHLDGFVNRQNC